MGGQKWSLKMGALAYNYGSNSSIPGPLVKEYSTSSKLEDIYFQSGSNKQ